MNTTTVIPKIEGKKYALNNSYFKYKGEDDPDSVLQIVRYWNTYKELPFDYTGEDWVYQAMIERQKKRGVILSQYLTPDSLAEKIATLSDSFHPENLKVLDACCGTGQLTRHLLAHGLNVEGFDTDKSMVKICRILYPDSTFYEYSFTDKLSDRKWDLIVSNPPFEEKQMKSFMPWLESALTPDGKAIVIVPTGFMDKKHPSIIRNALNHLDCLHQENASDSSAKTKSKSEILIFRLKDEYKTQNQKTTIINKNELMETEKVFLIGLDKISPNPENSRKKFNQDELNELAHSIKEHGLLHPITLRTKGEGYEIVYGERRYRAVTLNGETQIPAIIREYTDEQVLEITLIENINRKDLSAIEESDAYQKLMDNRGYDIDNICHMSGKTESYIRNRLRLQHLIDEFKTLLDRDEISLGVGIETGKYSKKVQKQIYTEYFTLEENNWKDLGLKEYTGRIEKLYSNDLSKFNFDKTECEKCQSNTALYELFPGKSGKCTNAECLLEKKNKFTVNFCKVVSEKYPQIGVCIAPYDKMNETINTNLKDIGVDVKTMKIEEYPECPPKPDQSDYASEAEYKEALDEYNIEDMAYSAEMGDIEDKIKSGEFKRVIYIGDNNPMIGYVKVTKGNELSPSDALKKQDAENKLTATRNVAKEVTALLQASEMTGEQFSVFEDELIIFIMLETLNKKYYPVFGFNDKETGTLTDEERYKITKSITPEQKTLVYRDFLVRCMTAQMGGNFKRMLLIEFAKQHFNEGTMDIVRKHTDIYNQKAQKIQKQMETLTELV